MGLVKSWGTLTVLAYTMCRKVTNHVAVKRTGNGLPLIGMARDSITSRGIARILILPLVNEVVGVLVKNRTNMALMDLWSQGLGEDVRNVDHPWYVNIPEDTRGDAFTHFVVRNRIVLLLERRGRESGVGDDRLVVSKHVGWAVQGTPRAQRLKRSSIIISAAMREATISEPKVEDSTVACRLENQRMGVQLRKTSTPDTERRVTSL